MAWRPYFNLRLIKARRSDAIFREKPQKNKGLAFAVRWFERFVTFDPQARRLAMRPKNPPVAF
jgi:hypothetical protein